MAEEQIRVGDIGTKFQCQVVDNDGNVVDLSPVGSIYQYTFKKPDGSLLTVTPSLETDGTDGWIIYRSLMGDLDQAGLWRLQVYVVTTATGTHRSDIGSFRVWPNLTAGTN